MSTRLRMAVFVLAAGWLGATGLWAIESQTGNEQAYQALLLQAANEPLTRWFLAAVLIASGLIWVPSSVFTIAGAALFGWSTLAIAWPSILVGAAAGYVAGRALAGRNSERDSQAEVERLAAGQTAGRIARLLQMVHTHPVKATALVRLTPGIPFGAQCVTFGAIRTPFGGYMLGTLLPTLITQGLWTVLGVMSSEALQNSYTVVRDYWQVGAVGTVAAVAIAVSGIVSERMAARNRT